MGPFTIYTMQGPLKMKPCSFHMEITKRFRKMMLLDSSPSKDKRGKGKVHDVTGAID
jgi:hypothetical protein